MSITYPIISMTIGGGEVLTFSGAEITSATLVEEIDPIGAEMPINVLEFKILTDDDSFSMFSGTYFSLLSERLPVLAYESIDGQNTLLGKFYLESWENVSEHEFSFRAVDILGVMDATAFDGGFWSTPTTMTAILATLLVPMNIQYTLAASLTSVEVSGWIPPSDYRKMLQQICFAAGATASTSRSQTLDIVPSMLATSPIFDVAIPDSGKSLEQTVKLTPLVTSIELTSHDYSQGTVQETIFAKVLDIGSHKIVFDKPYYNIAVDGPGYTPSVLGTEGGDYIVTEDSDYIEVGGGYVYGLNCLYLEMTEAGLVTITGYPWLESKKDYIFTETGITEYANKNVLKIGEATMVNSDNAQTVLNRTRDYYRQRYLQNMTLFASSIYPGNTVITSTYYGKMLLATARKMSTDLTGGCLGRTEIYGVEVPLIPPLASPVRRPRIGVAVCGAELLRQNMFREY